MSTLFGLLKKVNYYPSQYYAINSWFFVNSNIFFYKLQQHILIYNHVYDQLNMNFIKLYNKDFNSVFIVFLCVKFTIIIIFLCI